MTEVAVVPAEARALVSPREARAEWMVGARSLPVEEPEQEEASRPWAKRVRS